MSRLPWVASVLYAAVLFAGVSYRLAGLGRGGGPTVVFVAVMVSLLVLEVVERRRYGTSPPRGIAVALLLVRAALYLAATTVDGSGFARVLFVLIPFAAYFSIGRRASYGLAALCLAVAVTDLVRTPGWTGDAEAISDLLMLGIGLVFAVSMAAVAAEAEQGRAQLARSADQAVRMATVTERNRLARDIHDDLGHHLTAIAVQLEKATAFRDRDPDAADVALDDVRRSARQALADVRRSVAALREDDAPDSTATAMAALANGLRGADFAVAVDVRGDESRYAAGARLALYRAAQEALTNARRHAGADRVELTVCFDEDEALLLVADNGCGFAADPWLSAGFGLRGMRERLAAVGGTVAFDTTPEQGTRLTVLVPRAGA
jgi:signal transduction histidine kinase